MLARAFLAVLAALCTAIAVAQGPIAPKELPATVRHALSQAGVAEGNSAFAVVPLDGGPLSLALRDAVPMNPASTMKLLTTYAALATLGPDFHWRTEIFASRAPVGGRLEGDLFVRGGGDPGLVIERWWLLIQQLRALGIKEIRGDLVLDRSLYAAADESTVTLDGNELRPYNVAPDALLINFKTLSLEFLPDAAAGIARIRATPALEGVRLPQHVPLAAGACGDWKSQLKADFSQPHAPRFHGSYPRACGAGVWHVSLLSPDEYALASFGALWHSSGAVLRGGVRRGQVPAGALALAALDSPPLAQVIRDINKNSNNVMARQLFLTLGLEPENSTLAVAPADTGTALADGVEETRGAGPGLLPAAAQRASTARSIRYVQGWLQQTGLAMPELVLQNGSGLSRQERISAGSLARLLVHAWNSAEMPDFVASLPIAGVDGTMKKRNGAAHSAYIKTGYLAEVRAVAGYVFAASGHRYAVVALINDPNAAGAQAAHDALLQWVWEQG